MKKPTLIAAALFSALLIFYLVFEGGDPERKGPLQGERFLPLKAADVLGVKVVTREGLTFHCVKDTDGSWDIIEGEKKQNAAEKINDFIEAVTNLTEIDHFSVDSAMLSQYGLQEPTARITLTDLTQKTYEILVGDKTPSASTGVYVMLSDGSPVTILGAVLNWELYKLSSLFVFQDTPKQ
ncbi:MAG TPA: DUF4340 domain-containing protein [Syntrophales bacterium]|nr:DUF4340 domain-containing protein [Syntrophales bacterium]